MQMESLADDYRKSRGKDLNTEINANNLYVVNILLCRLLLKKKEFSIIELSETVWKDRRLMWEFQSIDATKRARRRESTGSAISRGSNSRAMTTRFYVLCTRSWQTKADSLLGFSIFLLKSFDKIYTCKFICAKILEAIGMSAMELTRIQVVFGEPDFILLTVMFFRLLNTWV